MKLNFRKWFALPEPDAEALIQTFHASLSASQRAEICLPWDYADETRGLLRRFIANHWQVTRPCVRSDFFSNEQQDAIFNIFGRLLDPTWHASFLQALSDDTRGHPWGQDQSIAFIGTPGRGPWQFLFTGRHLTLRAQGQGSSAFVFGAPVVYGHTSEGFHERPGHPGNVFWPQAIAAAHVRELLDARCQAQAEVDRLPAEFEIAFRDHPSGAPVASFGPEARAAFEALLQCLVQPYRAADRARIFACLDAQGGIDCLHIAFARAPRISAPLWDVWRIEGPAFVWHFQGWPHVHGWVHVASTPRAGQIRARHGAFLFPEHDELR